MISDKIIFIRDKNASVQIWLTPNTHKQELKQIYFILKRIKKTAPLGIYPLILRDHPSIQNQS